MERNKEIVKVSIQGIIVNIILVVFKSLIGLFTNSIAIILDAVNNLSDTLSSGITIIGMKLSAKKPDKEHPYGHGRIEYIASVLIAIIVLLAGVSSLKESIMKVINPEEATYTIPSLIIILVGVFVKFFFGRYVKNKGKALNSGSLIASGVDAISDSVISFSTFVAAIVSFIWHFSIEGYLGIVISVLILKTAIEILRDSINEVIGIRADSETTNKIRERILKYDEVQGVFDLTIHNYGPNKIIATAHIQVDDEMTAKEIHRLTRNILMDMYNEFGIIITIGIYASNDKGEYKKIKDYLNKIISEYENILQVHGFYVDEELKNISFDIIFNFEEEKKEEIIEEIKGKLKEKYPDYDYNVIIDLDFSD